MECRRVEAHSRLLHHPRGPVLAEPGCTADCHHQLISSEFEKLHVSRSPHGFGLLSVAGDSRPKPCAVAGAVAGPRPVSGRRGQPRRSGRGRGPLRWPPADPCQAPVPLPLHVVRFVPEAGRGTAAVQHEVREARRRRHVCMCACDREIKRQLSTAVAGARRSLRGSRPEPAQSAGTGSAGCHSRLISPNTHESDTSPFTTQSSRNVPSRRNPIFSRTRAEATLRVSVSA